MSDSRRSSGLGWFYLGAALGAVLAAGAVVVATEVQHGRSTRRSRLRLRRGGTLAPETVVEEMDLVEGLSHVVTEGLNVMADAVARLSDTFGNARREAIRYGIESEGAGTGHGGSSHGWYTGEDDEYHHPTRRITADDLLHDELDDIDPLPSP